MFLGKIILYKNKNICQVLYISCVDRIIGWMLTCTKQVDLVWEYLGFYICKLFLVLLDFRWTLKCEINSRIRKLQWTEKDIIPFSQLTLSHLLLSVSFLFLWCSYEREVNGFMWGENNVKLLNNRLKYNHGEYIITLLLVIT